MPWHKKLLYLILEKVSKAEEEKVFTIPYVRGLSGNLIYVPHALLRVCALTNRFDHFVRNTITLQQQDYNTWDQILAFDKIRVTAILCTYLPLSFSRLVFRLLNKYQSFYAMEAKNIQIGRVVEINYRHSRAYVTQKPQVDWRPFSSATRINRHRVFELQ